MSNLPSDFCFLYNGHPLDPNVESAIRAKDVAIYFEAQYIIRIDNVHCNIQPGRVSDWIISSMSTISGAPQTKVSAAMKVTVLVLIISLVCALIVLLVSGLRCQPWGTNYERVPIMSEGGDTEDASLLKSGHEKKHGIFSQMRKSHVVSIRPPDEPKVQVSKRMGTKSAVRAV